MFRARQIQRTAIELLLRCFELAVGAGSRTVEAVVAHWRKRSPASLAGILSGTVRRLVQGEATAVTRETDILAASRAWNAKVHGEHGSYDDEPDRGLDAELLRSLRMLARWWLRTHAWVADRVLPSWVEEGQGGRLSIGWIRRWVESRLDGTAEAMLRDAFSQLVFAQHVRVALARFDGEVQRLRLLPWTPRCYECQENAEAEARARAPTL